MIRQLRLCAACVLFMGVECGGPRPTTIESSGCPPPTIAQCQAGGFTTVSITGAEILVCENLAPPVGDQSDCRPTVRAP